LPPQWVNLFHESRLAPQTTHLRAQGRQIATAFDVVRPPPPPPPAEETQRHAATPAAAAAAATAKAPALATRKGALAARFVTRREAVRTLTNQDAPKATEVGSADGGVHLRAKHLCRLLVSQALSEYVGERE
jgi:hypothetical protein